MRRTIFALVVVAMTPIAVRSQGAITLAPDNQDAWFQQPCLGDSSDTFEWTRFDLHGIRIRVPRGARKVPVPGVDELKFQKGRATLRLRLHRDARALFREYNRPDYVYKYCQDDIGGLMAEAISFRSPIRYGFAANWTDADRGEYLTAVITGATLQDVTFLRRALFSIQFPGERRR